MTGYHGFGYSGYYGYYGRDYYKTWPTPGTSVPMTTVQDLDDRLWHGAVDLMDKELKEKAEPCNCSCGQHGCVSTKGAWS